MNGKILNQRQNQTNIVDENQKDCSQEHQSGSRGRNGCCSGSQSDFTLDTPASQVTVIDISDILKGFEI
jgi:uncharacterized protein (DUF2237 family)